MELWIAPAHGGKMAAALAEYAATLMRGPLAERRRTLWLAPTYAAAADVRQRLVERAAEAPQAALVDPGVTTFAGFASEIVWDAGLRVRPVSAVQRRQLLQRVVNEAMSAGALRFFRRGGSTAGLVSQLADAIAKLKRRDVSPQAFRRQVGGAAPRLRDFAELYRRYEERLRQAGAADAEGLLLAARDCLRADNELGARLELVIVHGFTDFTAAQEQIVALLAGRARRVVATLLGEEGGRGNGDGGRRALFGLPAAAARRLEALAGATRRGVSAEGPALGEKAIHPLPAALAHLERNIFRNYRDVEPVTAAVRESLHRIQIVAASGVQAEIEEIARRVKGLLVAREPPEEIVVVFRRTQEVADRVRRAFDDFGIPLYLDAWPRLGSAPLVRSLLNLLRLHAEDWPYGRLLRAITDRSLRLDLPSRGPRTWPPDASTPDARTAVELCVRHAQLPSGRGELLDLVESWTAADAIDVPVEPPTAQAAQAVLEQMAAWFDEVPPQAAIPMWLEHVERLATAAGLLEPSPRGATNRPARPSPATGATAAGGPDDETARQPWDVLARGLREVAVLERRLGEDGRELLLVELVELLESIAETSSLQPADDAVGRVRVLAAEAARFVRPRRLFVGGLSEQAFSAAESLRNVHDRAAQEDMGGGPADGDPPAPQPQCETMLLFYQLVTRPTESLTLSYPALDAKAQSVPPSPLLTELERAFGDAPPVRTVQPLDYAAAPAGPALSRSDLRRSAVTAALKRKREPLAELVRSPRYGELGRSLLGGIETVAQRSDRTAFGPYEGLFTSDVARALLERRFGSKYLWSPSLLETYAACPFQFLARHVLRLAPAPELALESDLARRGHLLHGTLARLYARLAAAAAGGARPTPAAVAEQFQEALDAVVESHPARGIQRALREIERRQIASWATQFATQHAEYAAACEKIGVPLEARHFEARFGPPSRRSDSTDEAGLSTDEPFQLDVAGETLKFAGRIDRIDVGSVGDATVFNVIDYKTSARARVNLAEMAAGRQLQLPLYALAAAELLLARQRATPLAAGYWSVRGKGFGLDARSGGPLRIGEIKDGRVQLLAGWTTLRQELLGRIAEIVTGIRRGWFPVSSADKECTQFCELSTACRIAQVRSLEKSWTPPAEGV